MDVERQLFETIDGALHEFGAATAGRLGDACSDEVAAMRLGGVVDRRRAVARFIQQVVGAADERMRLPTTTPGLYPHRTAHPPIETLRQHRPLMGGRWFRGAFEIAELAQGRSKC